MRPKVLVTGSGGQVGRALQLSEKNKDWNYDFMSRSDLDLASETSIADALAKPYDYIINAGAFTKVDLAEEEKESCKAVNTHALGHIAHYANPSTVIIHFSTDYVYNISPGRPLLESDVTKPESIYAITKLEGENALRLNHPAHVIIRTSWVYAVFGHNFVKSMLRLGKSRDELSIVSDQQGSPTYAEDIASAVISIIGKLEKKKEDRQELFGTYNYSNEGHTNWADFARTIFHLSGIDCKVHDISTEQFNAAAPRPLWSVMSKEKIKLSFGLEIPHWKDSLRICLDKILNQESS